MPNYFYVFLPEYYVWCLEINIICYLLHETDSVLTEDEAIFIADLYVKHNKGLEGCTQSFQRIRFLKTVYRTSETICETTTNASDTGTIVTPSYLG